MKNKRACRVHKRIVKWFPQNVVLPVYSQKGKLLGYSRTIVFEGCLDCGKVIVKDYGE